MVDEFDDDGVMPDEVEDTEALEDDAEVLEEEFEDDDENEDEDEQGDAEEEQSVAYWRDRFQHTQAKLGEQGNELGQLRQFRDAVMEQGWPSPEPEQPYDVEPAVNAQANTEQVQVAESALEKYDELVRAGWPHDAGDDHRTWHEALHRADQEHRLESLTREIVAHEVAPLKQLVLGERAAQLLERDIEESMPEVEGVTVDDVKAEIGDAYESWQQMNPEARATMVQLIAKSKAYDRLASSAGSRIPSPPNPRVAQPGGSDRRGLDSRLSREVAHLRAINPDITRAQAEARVRAYYGVKE